jgi:hypothetical protein
VTYTLVLRVSLAGNPSVAGEAEVAVTAASPPLVAVMIGGGERVIAADAELRLEANVVDLDVPTAGAGAGAFAASDGVTWSWSGFVQATGEGLEAEAYNRPLLSST